MTDGPGPDHSYRGYLRSHAPHQTVLNESWPHTTDGKPHAKGIDDRPAVEQVDVRVRVVLEHDGEVWIDGRAIRWNRSHVCVLVNDDRPISPYVWVLARDVRRRSL